VAGLGADELFAMGWYVGQAAPEIRVVCPLAHLPEPGGRAESAEEMLMRLLKNKTSDAHTRLFFISYFDNRDGEDVVAHLAELKVRAHVTRILQREIIVSLWE